MARFILSLAVLGSLSMGAAVAQPSDTLLYFGGNTPAFVYRTDTNGTVLKTVAGIPGPVYPQDLCMAANNRDYLMSLWYFSGTAIHGGIVRITPSGAVTTVRLGPPLRFPVRTVLDSDGDWLILDGGLDTRGLFRLSRGALSSIGSNLPFNGYSMRRDVETGQLLLRGDYKGQPRQPAMGYAWVDTATGAITTMVFSPNLATQFSLGAKEMAYDPTRGNYADILTDILFLTPSTTSLWTIDRRTGMRVSSVVIDRIGRMIDFARPHPAATGAPTYYALWVRNLGNLKGRVMVHLQADGTVLKSSLMRGAPTAAAHSALLRDGSRHLAWSMVKPPNGRVLNLSVPGWANARYVVGFSMSGTLRGPTLPDGRHIPLVPDVLTALSLKGGVRGILENTAGNLDANGRAVIKVDTNRLGLGQTGLRVWAVAVTLDTNAPSGVSGIFGPSLLVLR